MNVKLNNVKKNLTNVAVILFIAFNAKAQITNTSIDNEQYFATAFTAKQFDMNHNAGFAQLTNNRDLQKYGGCWASKAGSCMIGGGILTGGIGVYEMTRPETLYKNDGEMMLASGIACIGIGYLVEKAGAQY